MLRRDDGKLYVEEELVPIYRNEVLPHVHMMFPNQTECELLSGMEIRCEGDAIKAIDKLHSIGVKTVIVTSLFYAGTESLIVMGSVKQQGRFQIHVPCLKGNFTGTGDLFAALVLAYSTTSYNATVNGDQTDNSNVNSNSNNHYLRQVLMPSCEKAVNAVYAVLQRTLKDSSSELRLIQCKRDLETPTILFRAAEMGIALNGDAVIDSVNHSTTTTTTTTTT